MNSAEQKTGSTPEHTGHEEKAQIISSVMVECCSGMSATDKKSMMHDVMPRMMETMGDNSTGGMMSMMMNHCLRAFRWLPLIPLGFGIVLFLLGYFLSAEVVRILWLVLSAMPILMGLFGLFMMNAMTRR